MKDLKLTLIRTPRNRGYCHGELFNNNTNQKICDTLEDQVRDFNGDGDLLDDGEDKICGETAIPYGEYDIEVTYSPKFKRDMVLIKNVKHFTGIRMHYGRTVKNSLGCILCGKKSKEAELSDIAMTNYLVQLVNQHEGKGKLSIL